MLDLALKNKKILLIISIVLISPIIVNLGSELINLIIDLGRMLGTNIRYLIYNTCTF